MGIIEVFRHNFNASVEQINLRLNYFNTITIDTAFPGFLRATPRNASRDDRYNDLRHNVENTKLIQVGITLSDDAGNIGGTWQFNLSGFNPKCDPHSPNSVALLASSSINFEKNMAEGVKGVDLAEWMRYVVKAYRWRLRWVTFHGLYDFGYILAMMTGAHGLLPPTARLFLDAVRWTFGPWVYDLKVIMQEGYGYPGLGLENLARLVQVMRSSGVAHQAGSDSLLAAELFATVRTMGMDVEKYQGCLYGVTDKNTTMTTQTQVCGPSHANVASSSGVVRPEASGGKV